MNLKMKTLTAACAVALGGAALPAAAAPLAGPFDTPDLVVYLSGASAPDEFLASIAAGLYNGAKGAQWYFYTDNGPGTEFRAFFGEVRNDASIPASLHNQKVLFIKRSKGGSVFGVNPVARAQGLQTLRISALDCAAGPGGAGADYLCNRVGNDPGVAAPTGDEQVPDFGVSDVNPNLFKAPLNVEFGATDLSVSEAGVLQVSGVNALMMGHVVTAAVGFPMPSPIYRADYGSMLNGIIRDWSQVGNGSISPAAGTQVVVCRRTPGSGTQASYNWFYANFPCATDSLSGTGSITPARMSDSDGYQVSGSGTSADPYIIDPTAGYTVIENLGSGDVRTCLTRANSGGIYNWTDEEGNRYRANFGSGGYGAIGVLSMDSLGREGSPAAWRFINLDGDGYDTTTGEGTGLGTYTPSAGTGIPGTQTALIEGQWDFAVEVTIQRRNATVNGVPAPTGAKLAFINEFIERAGDPTFQKVWTAALPPAYFPPTANVAKATRQGNQCAPLQKFF
jgi:hypothetical protein